MKLKTKSWKSTVGMIAVVLAAILIMKALGLGSFRSGLRIGYVGQEGRHSWTAEYALLDGTMTHSLIPDSEADTLVIETLTQNGILAVEVRDADGQILFSSPDLGTQTTAVEIAGKVSVHIHADRHQGRFALRCQARETEAALTGRIFLYGEMHGNEKILEKEAELWEEYYRQEGMRHLFIEIPYYTAEFLNEWMKAENDDLLNEVFADWAGTASDQESVKVFYQRIKRSCPETVFHGTDVGHQFDTTGRRFLQTLQELGEADAERIRLTEEALEQGRTYYEQRDEVYRENKLAENFIKAYDKLDGAAVMGIYGSAHTGLDAAAYLTQTIPCMANQLRQHYGSMVVSEDLTFLARDREPLRTDILLLGGHEYEALYFGKADLSAYLPEYQHREFWRLENAYEDFKDCPLTGNVLPYPNFPMKIETGQVFVIDYTKTDGSVIRETYRSDGTEWQGAPTTVEFIPE